MKRSIYGLTALVAFGFATVHLRLLWLLPEDVISLKSLGYVVCFSGIALANLWKYIFPLPDEEWPDD